MRRTFVDNIYPENSSFASSTGPVNTEVTRKKKNFNTEKEKDNRSCLGYRFESYTRSTVVTNV